MSQALVPAPPPSAGGASAFDDDAGSECTDELIDRILENYQFHFKPETRVKLKQRCAGPAAARGDTRAGARHPPGSCGLRRNAAAADGWEIRGCQPKAIGHGNGCTAAAAAVTAGPTPTPPAAPPCSLGDMAVGVCYAKPWDRSPRWRFTLKPSEKDGTVGRYVRSLLVVPALSTAAVFSSKIRMSIFRLQFVVSYNWERNSPNLEYRWAPGEGAGGQRGAPSYSGAAQRLRGGSSPPAPCCAAPPPCAAPDPPAQADHQMERRPAHQAERAGAPPVGSAPRRQAAWPP
jgi:hypothetical protein